MKVRAALLFKVNDPIRVTEVDLEGPRFNEVLVKVRATGVCHSDWHVVTGATRHPLPVILGHEGAGIVEAVGSGVGNVKPGDQVVLNWAPACGSCFYCTQGRPSLCSTFVEALWGGTMLDGSTRFSLNGTGVFHFSGLACFAERIVVPKQCCVKIPSQVPFDVAALIGCAVTTGVGAALNTARIRPGSSVAVFGAGGVGLSIILGARYTGASLIVAVDRTLEKKPISERAGATHFFLNNEDVVRSIRDVTEGRGADYVFEAAGLPSLQERCLDAVRPGGVLVLAGISPMGSMTNFPGAILTRQEKTVMGSYYGTSNPAADFPAYARLYLEGKLPLNTLVSKSYRLDNINDAYGEMLEGGIARNLIVF